MKHDFKPYLSPIFIETGSYIGDGIKAALNAGFERVISIELSEYYYIYCREKIRDERVTLLHGDSILVLPQVLKDIKERCTFWLDGHFMTDPRTGSGIKIVPLWEELQVIAKHHIKNHTILIDDIRLLRTHTAEWTHLEYCVCDIEELIHSINPEYKISYDHGVEMDDILIAQV